MKTRWTLMNDSMSQWRANFLTGLAVLMPAILTLAFVVWFFMTLSNITDHLLVFLPSEWTHQNKGEGPLYWYWSLLGLAFGCILLALFGRMTRHYLGVKIVEILDRTLSRIPMLNKIYGVIKQVNEAFTSNNKTAFKQVVMVEFPRPGQYSVGFISNDHCPEIESKTNQRLKCVFIPLTPNITSGYLIIVPENDVKLLNMSVSEGLKFIVSLGALNPESIGQQQPP